MLHNKQKMICHTLIIALTIVILGFSSYSSIFAISVQSAIHHHKVFDKKQDSDSDSKDARSDGSDGRPSSSSDKIDDHLQISSSHSSDSGSSSSSSDTKSSDNTNNVDSANTNKNNNDQSTNDGSNTGADNNLQAVEPAKTGEQQQQSTGKNSSLIGTATSTSHTSCEQGSNCTDQQGLSDHDRSTTDNTTTTKQDNMPFVLPFP
jgi:cytoskeletal protein RodZ